MMLFLHFITILTLISTINSQLPMDCGRRLRTSDWPLIRIIGGIDAKPGDYPWQASILVEIPAMNRSMHICGGTLISDQWILTAAHCMDDPFNLDLYSVVIDQIDLDSTSNRKFSINKTIVHKDWDLNKTINDIALIKLTEKVNMNGPINQLIKPIEPICLPKHERNINYMEEGTKCYATGWGSNYAKFNETNFEIGPISRILKQVKLPIFDINKCFDVHYSKSGDPLVNITSEICAGGSEDVRAGVCVGDSGGPLQCQMSDNRWYQIGIVSWSYRCAAPGVPDVFTKVSLFNDWIENTIQNN